MYIPGVKNDKLRHRTALTSTQITLYYIFPRNNSYIQYNQTPVGQTLL